jgi:uncharacterized protein YndB with AHSA1/START domain
MDANTDVATEPADRVLVLERIFDAPRRLVFKAWTEPEHLVRWWGPKGFTLPECKLDLRRGGRWRFCMRAPDGTNHWLQGVYREIVENERLVFTYAWEDENGRPKHETVVTATFADERGGKTRLDLHHAVFESANARNEHEGGWTSTLDRLADLLATLDDRS